MGTYTTNYNLFMPTVGEQGWGELVNGNFTTIDITMKGFDTRIGTLEPLSIIQVDSNENVTFPAKVSAIGGFKLDTIGKLSNEDGIVGTLKFDSSITLASKGQNNTYTYRANPLSNNANFTLKANRSTFTSGSVRSYLSINGVIVADTGTLTSVNSSNTTTYEATLNDGDIINAVQSTNDGGNSSGGSIVMTCSGYLINN